MHVILWRYQVKRGREAEFEQTYGPEGSWTRLFRCGDGFMGTELLHDDGDSGRYLTIDRWSSHAAYAVFQAQWQDAYQSLDRQCETLTEQEVPLGTFSSVPLDGTE
jgi:heme-degrading monooxygenase HmoA